jgi:peptidoglycan/LPS O-acetylase OafA/YrhL
VLALVFFVAPLIPLLQGPTLDYLVDRQAWAWLYGVNIYIAKHGEWAFSYLDHFWSLAIEEHFYLFWPLLVFVLARRPRTLIAMTLATVLGAMLARPVGSLMGLSWWTTYTLTPFRLDGLALGAFLAVAARQPRRPGAAGAVAAGRGGGGPGAAGGHLRLDAWCRARSLTCSYQSGRL